MSVAVLAVKKQIFEMQEIITQLITDHYFLATVLAIWASLLLLIILFYLVRERKRLRSEVNQGSHRMDLVRRIIGGGHVYLLIADKHGEIIDVHPDIQTILGIHSPQLIGKDMVVFADYASVSGASHL